MGTIRELTSHRVNGLNEALRIFVLDEPGSGNACHDYVVLVPRGQEEGFIKLHDWDDDLVNLHFDLPLGDGKPEKVIISRKDPSMAATAIKILDKWRINGRYDAQHTAFQNGPVKEAGYNGNSHEALLAILLDRMESFQAGPYACHDNQMALDHLQGARLWLHKRTMDRVARQVEGTNQK
jgi:hypothetical protein